MGFRGQAWVVAGAAAAETEWSVSTQQVIGAGRVAQAMVSPPQPCAVAGQIAAAAAPSFCRCCCPRMTPAATCPGCWSTGCLCLSTTPRSSSMSAPPSPAASPPPAGNRTMPKRGRWRRRCRRKRWAPTPRLGCQHWRPFRTATARRVTLPTRIGRPEHRRQRAARRHSTAVTGAAVHRGAATAWPVRLRHHGLVDSTMLLHY